MGHLQLSLSPLGSGTQVILPDIYLCLYSYIKEKLQFMSSFILWSAVDNDTNSEDKFKEIATWWTELEGKSVEYRHVAGRQKHGEKEEKSGRLIREEPPFTIQNPRLDCSNLSFEKQGRTQNILVQGLELDIEHKQLKVFSSDPHQYIFTQVPAPGAGSFRRETMF